jgi:4-alpha-glucanotransferase
MSAADPALLERATRLGIQVHYRDVHDQTHLADPAALAVAVEQLAADAALTTSAVEPVVVIFAEAATTHLIHVEGRATDVELRLGDGTAVETSIAPSGDIISPAGLPVGCHDLIVETAAGTTTATLVCAPASMTAAASWYGGSGLFVPTYALWDHDTELPSFGLLGRLAQLLAELDTELLTTLPLYATFLDEPFDPSPYAPASRLHWNEIFLDDDLLPETPVPHQGRHLDWAALGTRRRAQLLAAVDQCDQPMHAAIDRFIAERPDVTAFARFMTDRRHGDARERRSHELAQFLANRQLADLAAAGGAGLAIDLPIGCHVDGYERWAHPELFAAEFSIGAPPDLFFTRGQNWGLPPQLPAAGRRSGHRLWRDLLARAGEHAALLRIDHVMAVHRLWWVPEGFEPHRGVYVNYPREELLAVIAATAARTGTTMVGEDLGTVPEDVGEAMQRWQMLGMYEEQFHTEDTPLPTIPERSIAGIRTHDMAPFAAFVADQGGALAGYRRRVSQELGHAVGDAYEDLLDAVIERLAQSRAAMVTMDLDDLVGEKEPHNVPGTVHDTTWRRRLDRPLSELLADSGLQRRLRMLGNRPRAG